ncbi:TGBp1 family protein [Roseovarius sp. LXJ103]|uniref:hypothetical protein n=1 Tax=Roseovarius carneus TaxID=2853164 RepID=UPI000D609A73|nr:hypothetical protein [Roseovarius carneus]MBZ8118759.1 TGBp1 family protein [Roseovarius carneus]PWE35568.1 hypothetical protein DD563_06100 [Pelagicola sp. LXJ1103]
MAILIVVEGVGNSGKSTSIKDFARANLPNFSVPRRGDIKYAGPLTKNSNQYTIGVRSAGDTGAMILDAIQCFKTHNCDLMVCATKSRGITVDTINAYIAANPSLTVHRIQTQSSKIPAQQLADNARVAQKIWSHIP